MTTKLQGIGASPGIILGNVLLYQEADLGYQSLKINQDSIADEKESLEKAIVKSSEQLEQIYEQALEKLGEEEAEVFQAHLMMLQDPEIKNKAFQRIEESLETAVEAIDKVTEEYADLFRAMDNEYMRERVVDILDISRRIMANLLGVDLNPLQNMSEPAIIVAHDLTPSTTALMDKEKVLGFVTKIGGRTSHTAIMARSLEIPAVLGVSGVLEIAKNQAQIILDAETGQVLIDPDETEWAEYATKRNEFQEYMKQLLKLKERPAETFDGHRVELAANIGSLADLEAALKYGAEGVGLFRTEFLYMDRTESPSEDEQYKTYKAVLEAFGDKPVVIRTLDIGGDKEVPYLNMPKEMNPFMGWRAVRFCLDRKDIFKAQLRALLRASNYGNLHIMYPFIAGLEDLRAANEVLNEVKSELRLEGIAFDEKVKVGIMMEIPSAALIADRLAKEVDFFSIGTNDLIQYTMAADRMNEKVSGYYQPFHPGVLRLIKQIVEGAHSEGIWVGMCGEMAGDPEATETLLGLGLDELSMSASSILKVKKRVLTLNHEKCKKHVNKILE
ncbi:MAG: phosphoenolpyruvate--protein phosphotransferase [Halanaerobiales bacterium]|nr:phosphoenolpyruvate--protein phosphotransferase [Halanaerobiales bacterium]